MSQPNKEVHLRKIIKRIGDGLVPLIVVCYILSWLFSMFFLAYFWGKVYFGVGILMGAYFLGKEMEGA